MYCMYCGMKMNDDMKFCPYCGKQMPTLKPAVTPHPESGISAKPPQQELQNSYHVTIVRMSKPIYPFSAIHITVDGNRSYEVKNGETVSFDLSKGMHQLVFSVFSVPQKVTVPLDVCRDRRLTCYMNAANALVNVLLAKPAVVMNENGIKY